MWAGGPLFPIARVLEDTVDDSGKPVRSAWLSNVFHSSANKLFELAALQIPGRYVISAKDNDGFRPQ